MISETATYYVAGTDQGRGTGDMTFPVLNFCDSASKKSLHYGLIL